MSVYQVEQFYVHVNTNTLNDADKEKIRVLLVENNWDDHDFGANDAGKEYSQKEASREIMLNFWEEPQDSLRRSREDGIYTSYTYGQGDKSIQVILPDLRWNRANRIIWVPTKHIAIQTRA